MVDGDVLRRLFRSFARNDDAGFRDAASMLIREERMKNHRLLADDLEKILYSRNGKPSAQTRSGDPQVPRDKDRDFPLVEITVPEYDWDRLVIPPRTLATLKRVAEENRRSDLLATAGLLPTRRVLFYGPPGCGKTLAAHVLAGVLGLPLVTARFDAIVSSFLGETAANLRRVFDFIANGRYVVLFDEFDAIGKDRDNAFEHGELKRVVNSLLQLLDSSKADSLLIAATNHEGLLDSAVWRRFDAVVRFDLPSPQERTLLLRAFLRGFAGVDFKPETLSRKLEGATGADIERLAVAAVRNAVLENRRHVIATDFAAALTEFAERQGITSPSTPNTDATPRRRRKE